MASESRVEWKGASCVLLAHGTALLGRTSTDVVLYSVEFRDSLERLADDRRGTGRREFEEARAHVRQQKASTTPLSWASIAAIVVDLQGSRQDGIGRSAFRSGA